jgi:polysaccharide chain length determinant protein (PEP-CTERM system associated)
MKELFDQALSILRGMWRRRWMGLAAAWIALIVGVAVVYRIPVRYEAQARVYVDTDSLLKPLLAGLAIQPNLDQQVSLISRTLISRPNIERLVRTTDLDLGAKTDAQRDALIDSVMKTIQLAKASGNLYFISYRDTNPEQARKVVQALLNIFMESSLGDKTQDTQTSLKFLDDQIARYEQNLRTSEDRLKAFKIKNMGVVGRSTDYFNSLTQLQSQIDAARMDLQANEQARDSYKRELAGETPTLITEETTQDAPRDGVPEFDVRIAALQSHLDDLLRRYTEEHPDVVSTRRLLAQLAQERQAVLAARKKSQASTPKAMVTDRNPVFQQLRISLAEAEANVASARAKLQNYEGQYRDLKSQAQRVPEVEQQYAELNRDYDVQKKTYENLLARREAAAMGKDVQATGGAQFRVIDPPRVSPNAVEPNRILLLSAALLLSVAIGLGVSFAASQLMPTFQDARTLREVSRRPILGMVSAVPRDGVDKRRRRNRYLFAGGLGSLFAAFVAVMTFAMMIGRGA